MPKSHLRQLASFIRAFGLIGGIRVWCSIFFQSLASLGGTIRLRLPGVAAPLHLRRQDLPIFWQVMIMREYEIKFLPQSHRLMAMYQAILAEGKKPIIIDCGGHVGLSAIWFATQFPDATIYVVEPDISNFKLLQVNTASYSNVTPLHGGVWPHPCRLMIANPGAGSASFRLQEVPDFSNLPQSDLLSGYTIEGIGELGELRRLFLVKIDIEGAEAELFQGPAEWLRCPALVVIELHDWLFPWQGTSRNLFRQLAENNFDAIFRGENLLLFRP